jgi:hypothetical protein
VCKISKVKTTRHIHVGTQAFCHADRGRQLGMKAGSGIGRQEEAVRINLAGKGKQGRRKRQVKATSRHRQG